MNGLGPGRRSDVGWSVFLGLDDPRHGVDEGQMGEGLGKFPRCSPVVVSISSA